MNSPSGSQTSGQGFLADLCFDPIPLCGLQDSGLPPFLSGVSPRDQETCVMSLRNEHLIWEATDMHIHLVSSLPVPLMRFEVRLLPQGAMVKPQTLRFCNCAPYCVHSYRLVHTCPFSTSPCSGILSGYRVTLVGTLLHLLWL